ncbi:hypothetical protein DRW41_22330 [Neobacillus piezotolerans]|uniref:Lipoprotein n=1 Tax=Neobacillus piezotolerans TaxID=2259171 RepID=A0A3D8GK47_9BACI|nr:hypothetical protein [Neobacillus piezotolerans]RDU34667.1 hypothetical protein DRW41_22330 [Neobacillus piezotolerans]
MKNILFYILIILMVATIGCFVLGYQNAGYLVGFIFAAFAMSVGLVFSIKNRNYTHKYWHDDYAERRQKKKE